MKTNQVMIRPMGVFSVEQRTKDSKFNATALLKQWNKTVKNGDVLIPHLDGVLKYKEKDLYDYMNIGPTKDLIKVVMAKEGLSEQRKVVNTTRGKYGGTWLHPIMFVDFCMWINPSFKYDVIKFVYDRMIEFRNNAGDAYNELGRAVSSIVSPNFIGAAMKKVGEALNWIIFNKHEKALRNKHGDERQMRALFELEREVAMLINKGFIKDYKGLICFLRDEYKRRNLPSVFTE